LFNCAMFLLALGGLALAQGHPSRLALAIRDTHVRAQGESVRNIAELNNSAMLLPAGGSATCTQGRRSCRGIAVSACTLG